MFGRFTTQVTRVDVGSLAFITQVTSVHMWSVQSLTPHWSGAFSHLFTTLDRTGVGSIQSFVHHTDHNHWCRQRSASVHDIGHQCGTVVLKYQISMRSPDASPLWLESVQTIVLTVALVQTQSHHKGYQWCRPMRLINPGHRCGCVQSGCCASAGRHSSSEQRVTVASGSLKQRSLNTESLSMVNGNRSMYNHKRVWPISFFISVEQRCFLCLTVTEYSVTLIGCHTGRPQDLLQVSTCFPSLLLEK